MNITFDVVTFNSKYESGLNGRKIGDIVILDILGTANDQPAA